MWRFFSQGREREASAILPDDDRPQTRLAHAVSLLIRQPITQRNIRQAEHICQELAASPDDTQVSRLAAYLHARIAHVHRIPADLDAASARYQALWLASPENDLAQLALVKQATIELYRNPDKFHFWFDHYSTAVALFSSGGAKRDLCILLADAAQRFSLPKEIALSHLRTALDAAPSQPTRRAELLIRIAELARITGDQRVAAIHYQAFIREYPRDNRHRIATERLQSLPESPPDAPAN